jgi:hypothetical protein
MPPAVGNETSDAPSSTIGPSAPVVVGVIDIVNAAINNSINTHASTSAPAAIATTAAAAEPTAGSFIQTANELTRESDGSAAEDAQQAEFVVDKRAEKERKRKQKQREKQELQQKQLEEMKNAPFEAIQLTADGDDVLKIGSVAWENVELKYRQAYLKHKQIKYGRERGKDQLGAAIVSYLKAQPYKTAISNSRRSSAATTFQRGNGTVVRTTTKPTFLIENDGDGSLFRAANVILLHKECYVATKHAMDRSQLDSGVAHPVEWNTMCNTYNSTYDPDEPNLNLDCIKSYIELDEFDIDPMVASEHVGPLTVSQFMQLVGYMEGRYGKACKDMKKSGYNKPFMDVINGCAWLGYMRCTFMSVGNSSLHDTAFSELPSDVLNESTNGPPGGRKSGSRTTSPVPPGSNRKQVSSIAVQGAAAALDNRMSDLNRSENFDTLMRRTAERDDTEEEMEKVDDRLASVKRDRKVAKRDGTTFADEHVYKKLKRQSKSMHAKHERLSMEVQRLEKLLGYDDKSTGNMSSSSSSSDEDIDQYIDANDHDSA